MKELIKVNYFIKNKQTICGAEWIFDDVIYTDDSLFRNLDKDTKELENFNKKYYSFLGTSIISFSDFDNFFEFAKNNYGFKTEEYTVCFLKKKFRNIYFYGNKILDRFKIYKSNFSETEIIFQFYKYIPTLSFMKDNMNIYDFYDYCNNHNLKFKDIFYE